MADLVNKASWTIRPYRAGDRTAVRGICAATCWMGEYRREAIPDDWVWAEYWTRYFTDQEPHHTWVAVDDATNKVAGYLMGTGDVRRFHAYVPRLLPGIVWHVLRHRLLRARVSRRAILAMARAMLCDGESLPEPLAKSHPATWHFDLLPSARGAGLGGRLCREFFGRMAELGAPGIHAQILSLNQPVQRFLGKAGFALAHRAPTSAFRHITPDRIEVQTWVAQGRQDKPNP